MKVMQINCVYGKGSTGKLVRDMHTFLQAEGIESVVCYGRGEKVAEAGVYKTCGELYAKCNNLLSRFTGLMYGGCFLSTRRLINVIAREKPDIVHLHCINGYFVNLFRLTNWLKEQKIRTVLTLHAEFPYTANCGHALECEKWKTGCGSCPRWRQETKSLFFDRTHTSWRRLYDAYCGFDRLQVVSVSPWLRTRAERSPMLKDKHHAVVLNGLDTAVFHPYDDAAMLRQRLGIGDEKVVLHVTASFSDAEGHFKGGSYVLELARRLERENIVFLVAGPHSLTSAPPKNVRFLGKLSDQKELARLYSLADVTLLTSKRETFSMPLAESLCCGTPVVGFRAGGPESIAIPEYAYFTEYGDTDALEAALLQALRRGKATQISEAAGVYDSARMAQNYLRIYQKDCGAL